MPNLVIHPRTEQVLKSIVNQPTHAVILIGEKGIGKKSLLHFLAVEMFGTENIQEHPSIYTAKEVNGIVPIDEIREIQHFLSLKSTSSSTVKRLIMIRDADKMGREAQNALLKTIEEPPADSMVLLSASHEHDVLPTIMSRAQRIAVLPPSEQQLRDYFEAAGHAAPTVSTALLMSGGLPGAMAALLSESADHPFFKAADEARSILRHDTFSRLSMVDVLSKQRELCINICSMLERMAAHSLKDTTKSAAAQRQWQIVLGSAYNAQKALGTHASVKLILTDLMLSL